MTSQAAKRRIGVLGGMGPEATVHFMARVIARTQAADDSDHVPMLVDCNTQVPSRIKAIIEGTGEDPGPVIADMARRLEAMGAEALVMPCNTAHHYATFVEAAVRIPFLDMVKLTARRLHDDGARRIGVLASPAIRITGVFDRAFESLSLTADYPSDQEAMLQAVSLIKQAGRSPVAIDLLRRAASQLRSRGCECILAACSEFSLVSADIAAAGKLVDSIDVLADAAIEFASTKVPAQQFYA